MASAERENFPPLEIKPFFQDGRKPIEELFQSYSRIEKEFGWKRITLCIFTSRFSKEQRPVYAYCSPHTGLSIGLLGGIHGEEPSAPNAFAEPENLRLIGQMGQKIPMFLIPICNPFGYIYNLRYFTFKEGVSVGSCDHLLPDLSNPSRPRKKLPESPESAVFTQGILRVIQKYPPLVVFNFHEDLAQDNDLIPDCYIYSQGNRNEIAVATVGILRNHGFHIIENGDSGIEGIEIKNGIAQPFGGGIVKDNSIDEFFGSPVYYQNRQWKKKFATPHVIVPENSIRTVDSSNLVVGIPLERRKAVQTELIQKLPEFWRMAQKNQ